MPLLQGQHAVAVISLRQAAELQPRDTLEAQVLLAALTWQSDQAQAARLAGTALKQPGTFLAAFQRAELRAVARLLAGDPADASAELDSAAATRLAGDLFRQPLYDLLHDPPSPGSLGYSQSGSRSPTCPSKPD